MSEEMERMVAENPDAFPDNDKAIDEWRAVFREHGLVDHDIDFSAVAPEAIEAMGRALRDLGRPAPSVDEATVRAQMERRVFTLEARLRFLRAVAEGTHDALIPTYNQLLANYRKREPSG